VGKVPHLETMKVLGPHMGDALPLQWDGALRRMPSSRA